MVCRVKSQFLFQTSLQRSLKEEMTAKGPKLQTETARKLKGRLPQLGSLLRDTTVGEFTRVRLLLFPESITSLLSGALVSTAISKQMEICS